MLLLVFAATAYADLPQQDGRTHLGVATCASGVCHGSVRERSASRIPQNEFVVWSRIDPHRRAYQTLLSPLSREIAGNLGLANAHEAQICLDCHADNVPIDRRGAKFQIDDGIGCEACHGGAEDYISTHTDPNAPRAASIDAGLYPTDEYKARAALCLSCHLGTDKKIASHDIMGAGHPRLSFELDTFGILQPAHYVVDDDYRQRKWSATSLVTWELGQIRMALQTLTLIEQRIATGSTFPELSLFDCHACHHGMADVRWEPSAHALGPGKVRLNDSAFAMVQLIANGVDKDLADTLRRGLSDLHRASQKSTHLAAATARLRMPIERLEAETLAAGDAGAVPAAQLLSMIVTTFSTTRTDYAVAEQAVMAIDMLSAHLGLRAQYEAWLDRLFDAVADDDAFDPDAFVAAIQAMPKPG